MMSWMSGYNWREIARWAMKSHKDPVNKSQLLMIRLSNSGKKRLIHSEITLTSISYRFDVFLFSCNPTKFMFFTTDQNFTKFIRRLQYIVNFLILMESYRRQLALRFYKAFDWYFSALGQWTLKPAGAEELLFAHLSSCVKVDLSLWLYLTRIIKSLDSHHQPSDEPFFTKKTVKGMAHVAKWWTLKVYYNFQ